MQRTTIRNLIYFFIFGLWLIVAVNLLGCASQTTDGRNGTDGKPGKDGKDFTPATAAYTFGSNTNCQKIFTGYSAKKQSNTSSNLRIYATENCTGSIKTTLKEGSNEVYETSSFRATLEGTNATGLTLFVGGK